MSGHSKWATIKRQKGAHDQERGRIFSKLARTIALAARDGSDPATNFKLRLEVDKARRVNMPKENILRAISKGSGRETGEAWENITYEAFGPASVGLIIEAVSDNKNRTTAEIKNLLEKSGGVLANPGSVIFQFQHLGQARLAKQANLEEQTLELIDLGAEDILEEGSDLLVFLPPDRLRAFRDLARDIDLIWRPTHPLVLSGQAQLDQVAQLLTTLEDHADVQRVYSNLAAS
jgi:YebC/PmpR family DNA-binding regulatory protein